MSKLEIRLAALSKLVDIKSPAVSHRLSEVFSQIEVTLKNSTEYEDLSAALKSLEVLVPRYHMAILPLLEAFVSVVPTRSLTCNGKPILDQKLRFQSADTLIRETIDVAQKIGYIHTELVINFLLTLSISTDEQTKNKAKRALKSLATLDLNIFYGESGLGAMPQLKMVKYINDLDNQKLFANIQIVLQMLDSMLSPTLDGTSWVSYQGVAIQRGSIVSDGGVAEMRAEAIKLAKRVYKLEASVEHRRQVLQTLETAMRSEELTSTNDTSAMFERDAIEVLTFMQELVTTEVLPLIQTIEHLAYWGYYHAHSLSIKEKALEIRDKIEINTEYQIYKQLIGFEGIFGDWEELSRSEEAWDYSDKKRREAADQYLAEINDSNYTEWRNRILEFSLTQSNDLATFPIYYDFLQSIGKDKPKMAIEFLNFHEEIMAPFFIALMRGLWRSVRSTEIEKISRRWIEEGKYLTSIAKSLYEIGDQHLDLLTDVVDKASALYSQETLIQSMGVAASLYVQGTKDAKNIFMRSLRSLAAHNNASWASSIWFSRDIPPLLESMSVDERTELLATLLFLPAIDHRVENILYEIGRHDVQAILEFLAKRLNHERKIIERKHDSDAIDQGQFVSVPYQMTKLNDLLKKAPDLLLKVLRDNFYAESRYMLRYRGARIVKSIFPTYGDPLDELLLQYINTGNDQDFEFAIGILSAFEGSAEILKTCKEIIRTVPENSKMWNEVASVIETTGVVGGEYGLVEAFEQKFQWISVWMNDEDERIRNFANWLGESLQCTIESERQRANQGIALRKYRYGENKDE